VGTKFYELRNVASCVAYWQIYVAYILFVLLNYYPFLYFKFLFRPRTIEQWLAYH